MSGWKNCVASLHVDEYDNDLEEGALLPVLIAREEPVPLGDVDVHEEAPDSHEDANDDDEHEIEVGLGRRQVPELQVAGLVEDRHQEERGSLKDIQPKTNDKYQLKNTYDYMSGSGTKMFHYAFLQTS